MDAEAAGVAWHAQSAQETLAALAATETGLDSDEAARRQAVHGPNELPRKQRRGVVLVFVRQFGNPLIYILLAAGVVSAAIGNISDAGFIFGVLLFNATIGTVQEWRAESSAQALNSLVQVSATVSRDGDRRVIDARELVPGDVVYLESGRAVPADIRLLGAHGLRADESLLTGESVAVEKDAAAVLTAALPLGDRSTLLHAGTNVVSGRAAGVVCRTGNDTEVGRIAAELADHSAPPPLVLRLRRLTTQIAIAIMVGIVVLAAGQIARGDDPLQIFFVAVALAVAAIPEGLPVAITIALSIATRRMARRNVIVRSLPAVEGLGACTVIATDKTGTLTENRMEIAQVFLPGAGLVAPDDGGAGLADFLMSGALANEGEYEMAPGRSVQIGDAVDLAFLALAGTHGQSRRQLVAEYPEVARVPFESEHRFVAAFHRHGDEVIGHVKGAAEAVLPMCDADHEALTAEAARLAARGYRVLAVARGPVGGDGAQDGEPAALAGLRFLGFACLADPVRAEVPAAVARCRDAGIDIRMVTGDHPETARAVAAELGLVTAGDGDGAVVTGAELQSADDGTRVQRISAAKVFARVEPIQKTGIVTALRDRGDFVAVTGDGVNDAPALRSANIGVAMGQAGTDVARQAADLILTDDNFASIVGGVEEGRVAFDNVRKVTLLLISTGVAEIILFVLALLFNMPLPLGAVQLLWLNLVTQGIQDVALAFERGEPGVLARPPRAPSDPIVDRPLIRQIVLGGLVMGCVAFAVFGVLLNGLGWSEFEARNGVLLLMVLFLNIHVFNCRSETRSAFRVPLAANPFLIVTVIAAQGVHLVAMLTPGLRDVLDVAPVTLATWGVLAACAVSVIVVMEIAKAVRRG